jgi:hypothetical protein
MSSPSQFLQEYFHARTELHRQWLTSYYESHREQFFTAGYDPFRPERSIRSSDAEQVISIASSDGGEIAITSGFFGGRWRARYRLVPVGDSWQISSIEMECGFCHGTGRSRNGEKECRGCRGMGWRRFDEETDP